MMRQGTGYVYGSTARQLEVVPRRAPGGSPDRRPQRRPQTRPQPVKRRVDRVSVVLIAVTFAIALSVCYYYLQLQFQNTYLSENVVSLESEVMEMEKENSNELQALEQNVDLDAIYKKATKELGMSVATSDQIYEYESRKSTQVRLHNR